MNIITISLVLSAAYVNANPNCDHLGVNYYEQLGCSATINGRTSCPTEYKCPAYEVGEGFCMSGGKKYNGTEPVSNSGSVDCNCLCMNSKGSAGRIMCMMLMCRSSEISRNCVAKSILGGCCVMGQYCPDESEPPMTCSYNGKTYAENTMFYPDDSCWQCICERGFRGVIEKPFCRRMPCNMEENNAKELVQNCTPWYQESYDTTAVCCPSGYICRDSIINIELRQLSITPSKNTCNIGSISLAVNETAFVNFRSYRNSRLTLLATCTCKVGPHPLCTVFEQGSIAPPPFRGISDI